MPEILKHYANLHTHSIHSDGRYTPEELARIAKDLGYGALALTDHDTVTGNYPMKEACDAVGLEWIYGSEICARLNTTGRLMHLTAFHFDPEYPPLKEYLWQMSERYTGIVKYLFDRAVEEGGIKGVSWDEVLEYNKGVTWLCQNHVLRTMVAKGLLTWADRTAFYDKYFNDAQKKEAPKFYGFRDAEEMIPMLHEAGALVFVAHPHGCLEDVKYMAERFGIEGIEVWHGELPAKERREALRLAMEYDLYVSGGDDHSSLLGGQYYRFEHPEETKYFFPPRSLGTTKYFFEEIRDRKKKPDRKEVMRELIENDDLWQITGGIIDNL